MQFQPRMTYGLYMYMTFEESTDGRQQLAAKLKEKT